MVQHPAVGQPAAALVQAAAVQQWAALEQPPTCQQGELAAGPGDVGKDAEGQPGSPPAIPGAVLPPAEGCRTIAEKEALKGIKVYAQYKGSSMKLNGLYKLVPKERIKRSGFKQEVRSPPFAWNQLDTWKPLH